MHNVYFHDNKERCINLSMVVVFPLFFSPKDSKSLCYLRIDVINTMYEML